MVGGRESNFPVREPKPDHIRAIKLQQHNLTKVAAEVVQTLGKGSVEVIEDQLLINGSSYHVGAYLVEDYSYVDNRTFYRSAYLSEREKYDLR